MIDNVQESFVRNLGIDQKRAFLDFNLAPLCLRRDIAALGFLHKIMLGRAHPALSLLFKRAAAPTYAFRCHSKQFANIIIASDTLVLRRSLLGMCSVYNRLSQGQVDIDTVSDFQSTLTANARISCQADIHKWHRLYNCRVIE